MARRASLLAKPEAPHPSGRRRPKRCVAITDGTNAAPCASRHGQTMEVIDASTDEPHGKSLDRNGYPRTPSERRVSRLSKPLIERATFARIAAPPKPSQNGQRPSIVLPSHEHGLHSMSCAAASESQFGGYGNVQPTAAELIVCVTTDVCRAAVIDSGLAGCGQDRLESLPDV